jgi:hypothetical protein
MTAVHRDPNNGCHPHKCVAEGSGFSKRPRFEDLPLKSGHSKGSAWGLWGADDERETLTLLTEDVVFAVGSEVSLGKVISLKQVVCMVYHGPTNSN